jgi:plastocyanin domain-containing protein
MEPAGGNMPNMPGMAHDQSALSSSTEGSANAATVEVSSKGFTPDHVMLKAGVPARLTFIRMDAQNCATEITLPDYNIRRVLPLHQPVVIEFTPRKGEITFTCGMNMLSGKVIGQ